VSLLTILGTTVTFLVNEGIKSRYAIDPFYKDVKTPASTAITGQRCPENGSLSSKLRTVFRVMVGWLDGEKH
jgi:hypothetical protein